MNSKTDEQTNPEWEEKARLLKAESQKEHPPEGTLESLGRVAKMIKEYAIPEFPANEFGQVHFMRVMFESVVDEIEAYLKGVDFLKIIKGDPHNG